MANSLGDQNEAMQNMLREQILDRSMGPALHESRDKNLYEFLDRSVAGPTDVPLQHDDIRRMQEEMMHGVTLHARGGVSYYDGQKWLRIELQKQYPEGETFLKDMSNMLSLDPIQTVIECIRELIKIKAEESEDNRTNSINQELQKLEKEKASVDGQHFEQRKRRDGQIRKKKGRVYKDPLTEYEDEITPF